MASSHVESFDPLHAESVEELLPDRRADGDVANTQLTEEHLHRRSVLVQKARDGGAGKVEHQVFVGHLAVQIDQVAPAGTKADAADADSMGIYPYEIIPEVTLDEALEMVGLMEKSESYITNLSGGERRRAFIAMTLLQGAGLLLFDEPLANLDIKYQIEIIRLLRELRDKKQISIIMALHDINMALQFERVMVIKDGGIAGMGKPEIILSEDLI